MNEKPTYHDLEQRIKELEKTTIESEEKFATFFLKSPIPMAITVMKDGRYVEVNEAFAKVMGLKREELIDNTSVGAGYITAEDRAIFLDEYRRKGFVENLELQMHVKGGEPRYGLFNSSKITIGDKDFFLTQVTDVTERKWVEEALHKSEERFRTIFENAVEGIFVTTPEGRFLRANTAAARMLGYESPEELIAAITDTGSQLYTNPEDRDTMFTLLQKHGFVRNYEVRCRHRNGSIIWGMLNMRLARDDEGNILHIEGTCQDITARKRAEEAVKQSENRLSGIIEFLPDATFAINLEGKIITWNRAIEEMTGFSAETMLGKGDYEYGVALYQERCPILVDLPFSWDDDIAKRYSFINKDNGTFYAERDVPHMRGRKRTLWCKASPLRDESGDIIGAIESIRDVTDRKQAEEALREAKDYTENLINSANVLIVGLDTVGRITLLNEAGEKMTGYRADEVIGKSWVELFISRATGLRVADEFDS